MAKASGSRQRKTNPKPTSRPQNSRNRSPTPSTHSPSPPPETEEEIDPYSLPGSTLLYRTHGVWEFMADCHIDSKKRLRPLSSGRMCSAYIDLVTAHGRTFPVICKEWNIWRDWQGFFSELYLYASPNHLRPLQGRYVPHIIGVIGGIDDGVVSILMDMPHGTLDWWKEAHPNEMSDVALSNALKAYQAIHAAGVLHNDVELRHILVTPDDEVMLIDFQMSRSTKPNRATDLWPCTQRELEAEMRKVKYLLDYKGARAREDRIWESGDEKISRRNRDLAGLRCQGTEVAQLPDEDIDPETGKYFVVDPRPGMFECKKNPATSGREFTVPPLYEYDIWRPPKEDHLPPLQPSASISSTEETLAPSATSSAGVISLAPHSEDDESELFQIQQTDHCINYKVPEAPQHLKGGDLQPPSELSPTQVSFAASTQPPNQCEQELVATATLVGPLVESGRKRKRSGRSSPIQRKLSKTDVTEEQEASLSECNLSRASRANTSPSVQSVPGSRRTPQVERNVPSASTPKGRKKGTGKTDDPVLTAKKTPSTPRGKKGNQKEVIPASQRSSKTNEEPLSSPSKGRRLRSGKGPS